MTLKITIDIFSGRANPTIELKGKEAKEALKRLKPVRELKEDEIGLPPVPTLGYRGLIIEQITEPVKNLPKVFRLAHGDVFGPKLAHRVEDIAFEDYILRKEGPIYKLDLGRKFPRLLKEEIVAFRDLRSKWKERIVWPRRFRCRCAPLYEPAWWNTPQIQPYNNCYNYSANYRTDTFRVIPGGGQPGSAAGAQYTSLTCASVKNAAIKDGLINSPRANNRCPKEGHLVALVIWPWVDFHWYRKGRNNYWSHKPGSTAVTNLDNSGVTIPDPRLANRGPYTDFCTFMVVMHGHVKIR